MKTVARSSDGQMIRWCLLGGDETSVGEEERREGEDKSRAPALKWQVLDRNWSQNSGRQWKTARMGGVIGIFLSIRFFKQANIT